MCVVHRFLNIHQVNTFGLLVALLALVLPSYAQQQTGTKIPPSMLRMSSPLQSPPSEIKFYGVDLNGNAFLVKLGAGLVMRFAGNDAFVDAVSITPPAPPPPAPVCKKLSVKQLQPDVAGNYVIGADATIVRNGMIMLLNFDYIYNGAGALPKEPWTGDTVLAVTVVDCVTPVASVERNRTPC